MIEIGLESHNGKETLWAQENEQFGRSEKRLIGIIGISSHKNASPRRFAFYGNFYALFASGKEIMVKRAAGIGNARNAITQTRR